MMGRRTPPRFTDKQTEGYAARKVAETQQTESLGVASIQAAEHIVTELLSGAKANPIIGCTVAIIVSDVMARAKMISAGAKSFIWGIVGVAFGAEVALDAVGEIASIFGKGTAANPADLVRPSPTTLVEASNPPPPGGGGGGGGGGKGFMGLIAQAAKAGEVPA